MGVERLGDDHVRVDQLAVEHRVVAILVGSDHEGVTGAFQEPAQSELAGDIRYDEIERAYQATWNLRPEMTFQQCVQRVAHVGLSGDSQQRPGLRPPYGGAVGGARLVRGGQ
jgi:hypothetical protein